MAIKAALGVIEFGDTPAAVGEIRSWNSPSEAEEIDTTVMGTGYASFVPGTIGVRVEAELFFEAADAGQALALAQLGNDTPQALALYPAGKGSGLSQLTGSATVMNYNAQGAADGAVELSITFAGDGAAPLVWGTQA
jgi:hypothetical protein